MKTEKVLPGAMYIGVPFKLLTPSTPPSPGGAVTVAMRDRAAKVR